MKMKQPVFLLLLSVLFCCSSLHAQTDSAKPLRIAVLAPLYLDSAFDDNFNYRYGNLTIPKTILPGLDFYNGIMMAVDTLNKEKLPMELWLYDTKDKKSNTEKIAKDIKAHHVSLVIASLNNMTEQKIFSAFAADNKIPFISATYPNDMYLENNPYYVMINSSLKTHVENIYKYVLRSYPIGKILFVTRKGTAEERISKLFADMSRKAAKLNYRTIELPDAFTEDKLLPFLDSNRQNIVICGSVNEAFGQNLLAILEQQTSYTTVAVGMPTWDGMKNIMASQNEELEIVYSTPFNFGGNNKTINAISNEYKTKLNGRPSDMMYKGYETLYHFAHLAAKYNDSVLHHLSENFFSIASEYRFEPVMQNITDTIPAYIENKKLYFIHYSKGSIKAVH